MSVFLLSAGLAFTIYQLLAFARVPDIQENFSVFGVELVFGDEAKQRAKIFLRVVIVVAGLMTFLLIHQWLRPLDAVSRQSAGIYLGFLFGPLLAIWINSVVFHHPADDLSRGQVVAGIGLVLLFLLGSVGNEAATWVRRLGDKVTGVKLAGAEFSFAERTRKIEFGSTPPAGSSQQIGVSGSSGLAYLAQLKAIIDRDQEYLKLFRSGGAPANQSPNSPDVGAGFAGQAISNSLGCLAAWSSETGDRGMVDKHLAAFAGDFRQLATLSRTMNEQTQPAFAAQRVTELGGAFVNSALAMAFDIVSSTGSAGIISSCGAWLKSYCEAEVKGGDPPGSGAYSADYLALLRCLSEWRDANKTASPPNARSADLQKRIVAVKSFLRSFVDQDGLARRPYFAIAYASIMAQLGHYPAAASILDDWIRQQAEREKNLLADPTQYWFALRARMFLAAYVEEWLVKDANAAGKAGKAVQDEHLANLQVLRDGLRAHLKNADFFARIDKECNGGCAIVFKRPSACRSEIPRRADLELWQKIYTSYVSTENTYVERAVRHPDYRERLAETTSATARRLANFDLSCAAPIPTPNAMYALALAAFVTNQVGYTRVRGDADSDDSRNRRLDEAERAARFGLEIIAAEARKGREHGQKPFLERVEPSLAAYAENELTSLRAEIDQIRKEAE